MIYYPRCFVLFSLIAGSSFSFVPSPAIRCRPASSLFQCRSAASSLSATAAPAFESASRSSRLKPMLAESEADTIFNAVDVNGSGTIELAELTSYMQRYLSSSTENGFIETLFSEMDKDESGSISRAEFRSAITREPTNERDADMIFSIVDKDGSGGIDLDELTVHLSSVGYTSSEIETLFAKIDENQDGEISRSEFRQAILDNSGSKDAPRGYFLNSVTQALVPLGPIGRISQQVETMGPFKRVYNAISNLFGVDPKKLKSLGVPFALSYSILSNISGAMAFSSAWYLSCKRTGLSPFVPGQWKSLLKAWGAVYVVVQFVKPFRVAGAIGMSKLSAEYLEMTKEKFNCSQRVAVGFQFTMGIVMMGVLATLGMALTSIVTGVPILG